MLRNCRLLVSFAFLVVAMFSGSASAFDTYFFPQTAAGVAGDLRMMTQFSIYNPTEASGQVAMVFFTGPEGVTWTLHTSCVENPDLTKDGTGLGFTLPAQTKYAINASSSAPAQGGWTMILSEVPLQVSATYGLYQEVNPGVGRTPFIPIWEAAVLPAAASHQASFPVHRMDNDVASSVDTSTGFAVANVGGALAEVTARLYNYDGSLKTAARTFSLPNRAHKAQFINELFEGVDLGSFRGVLKFSSNVPIAVVGLKESKNGAATVYSTTPVQAESSFAVNSIYELEDNGTIQKAQHITAPAEVHATQNSPTDGPESDFYSIDLVQGQRIQVLCLGDLIGSPLTVVLHIKDLAEHDLAAGVPILNGSSDVGLSYQATATGKHVISVQSVGGYGRAYFYRLLVRVQ